MFVYVNYILTQQCPAKDGGARRLVGRKGETKKKNNFFF